MNRNWLSAREWQRVQRKIPITCVDLLPVRLLRKISRRAVEIGLILRDTPHQGRRWCLIGGRVLYGETLDRAIQRQVRETLGARLRVSYQQQATPLFVAQYSPSGRRPFLLDPRQHAIGLIYSVKLHGPIDPQGEAFEFRWFDSERLPSPKDFGFGQSPVVGACLRRLRTLDEER